MKRSLNVYGKGYHIDIYGNVYGKFVNTLKQYEGGTNKYLMVCLSDKGITKQFLVHRLVALTFLEKVEGKDYVNPTDGNIHNNHVSNLEWVTASENMKHSYHKLGNTKGSAPMTGRKGSEHNKSKSIKIETPEGEIMTFGSGLEMNRETGYSNSAASKAIQKHPLPYTFKRGINKGMTILEYGEVLQLNREYYS